MHVVVYKRLGQYRWRMVASNGKKLANGGEAYRNKDDMLEVIYRMFGMSVDIEDRT